jgi:cell division protein FtsI (penicillin-binding protein 3)
VIRPHIASGRLVAAIIGVSLLWAGGVTRLAQVQISDHPRAVALSREQVEGWVVIPAERGLILDRNGLLVATNRSRLAFAAVPKEWRTPEVRHRAAERFSAAFGGTAKAWLAKFDKTPEFVYLTRSANAALEKKVRGWNDDAIFTLHEPGRTYLTGEIGRELLGNVDMDNKGVAGIERAYEAILAGKPARGCVRYDARRAVALDPLPASLAIDGSDLKLTLDWRWQQIVEQELVASVRFNRAKGGGAIFMTPQGAIRALAYAVNDSAYGGKAPVVTRCRPITDLYEPGSTFKAFTAAALLSEEKVRLKDSVYADDGISQFGSRSIRDSEKHGWLTFDSSLVVSSNIAFGKWAQRLDGSVMYRWARDFGFGTVTGTSVAAEPEGSVPNFKHWNELQLAQLAMGHSISVTPLQMVTAFAVFANGGDLYHPYLVDAIIGPNGDTTYADAPQKVRHVLAHDVVQTLRVLLARVVTEGTATQAQSKSVTIAGKTGTAQKVKEDGRGYYDNRFVASFVGFFPVDDPQVVGIVYLDEPRRLHYGGWTAGPAFRDIAERLAVMHPELLSYPTDDSVKAMPEPRAYPVAVKGIVPDLVGLPLGGAAAFAAKMGFRVHTSGTGCVETQWPEPGSPLAPGDSLILNAVQVLPRSPVDSSDTTAEPAREVEA